MGPLETCTTRRLHNRIDSLVAKPCEGSLFMCPGKNFGTESIAWWLAAWERPTENNGDNVEGIRQGTAGGDYRQWPTVMAPRLTKSLV